MALNKRIMSKVLLAIMAFSALAFMVIPVSSFADDVAVRSSILTGETVGTTWKGTIRVEVRNLTADNLRNVDLRLANPGPNAIEKGLFQFGGIPGGEVRSVTGGFLLDTTLGAPLLWKVDYDTAAGEHRQVILPGSVQ